MFAEMDILKELDHPNIVKIYELFQDQKNYYIVTE
jgi:calcium-dependent protein kinase